MRKVHLEPRIDERLALASLLSVAFRRPIWVAEVRQQVRARTRKTAVFVAISFSSATTPLFRQQTAMRARLLTALQGDTATLSMAF
jgi:hypothetical protein